MTKKATSFAEHTARLRRNGTYAVGDKVVSEHGMRGVVVTRVEQAGAARYRVLWATGYETLAAAASLNHDSK